MPTTFTLTVDQYSALIALARDGAATPDAQRGLDSLCQRIEQANNVTRYLLWIQWQEVGTPLLPGTLFPDTWPPNLRYRLELVTRPIARADVDQVLRQKAKNPVTVLVTPDPGATVGWTALEKYFTQ